MAWRAKSKKINKSSPKNKLEATASPKTNAQRKSVKHKKIKKITIKNKAHYYEDPATSGV